MKYKTKYLVMYYHTEVFSSYDELAANRYKDLTPDSKVVKTNKRANWESK